MKVVLEVMRMCVCEREREGAVRDTRDLNIITWMNHQAWHFKSSSRENNTGPEYGVPMLLGYGQSARGLECC